MKVTLLFLLLLLSPTTTTTTTTTTVTTTSMLSVGVVHRGGVSAAHGLPAAGDPAAGGHDWQLNTSRVSQSGDEGDAALPPSPPLSYHHHYHHEGYYYCNHYFQFHYYCCCCCCCYCCCYYYYLLWCNNDNVSTVVIAVVVIILMMIMMKMMTEVKLHCFSLFFGSVTEPNNWWRKKGKRISLRTPLALSWKKCHILECEKSGFETGTCTPAMLTGVLLWKLLVPLVCLLPVLLMIMIGGLNSSMG